MQVYKINISGSRFNLTTLNETVINVFDSGDSLATSFTDSASLLLLNQTKTQSYFNEMSILSANKMSLFFGTKLIMARSLLTTSILIEKYDAQKYALDNTSIHQ